MDSRDSQVLSDMYHGAAGGVDNSTYATPPRPALEVLAGKFEVGNLPHLAIRDNLRGYTYLIHEGDEIEQRVISLENYLYRVLTITGMVGNMESRQAFTMHQTKFEAGRPHLLESVCKLVQELKDIQAGSF